VTDINGNVKARHDYLPFGEELASSVGSRVSVGGYGALDGVRQKFTAKERDGESGLDYFLARYYSSAQGRFTSIDSSGPNLVDPQTLNKYRYGLNNPLRYVDPDGRYEEDVHRALTEVLALAAGFGVGTAERIGRADQWVDDNPATSPMGMWPAGDAVEKRRKYHFTTQQRRDELWSGFESSGSPDDLGVFFHAFQDSFAHEGYGPTWGHIKAGHAPDKTYNNPGKADRMANQSFGLLVNAVGVMNNKGKISVSYSAVAWDKLQPLVQAFNRARTMEEKQKIIQQIRQVALDHHKRVTKEREEEKRRHQDTVGPAA
jgi:RHS repeat-associated protein